MYLMADYTHHDPNIASLAPYGSKLINGFSNHAPMVIEAMAALGRGHAAADWLVQYRARIAPLPAATGAIDPDDWRSALGQDARFSDWVALLSRDIATNGWRRMVTTWVPRLTDGFFTAACHGVIRVGHAVRALRDRDTPERRRELAYAFAAWASEYQDLIAVHPEPTYGRFNGAELLAGITLLDRGLRKNDGAITRAVAQLAKQPAFAQESAQLACTDPMSAVRDLALSAVDVFLHNAHTPLGVIVFTHGVTASAAVRHLLGELEAEDQRRLLREALTSLAALHAVYAESPLEVGPAESALDAESLADAAIAHGDDHVIKLTEACLLWHRVTGEDRCLAAAERATAVLAS